MAEKKKNFGDLLNDAPLATQEDTVTLVGALARSSRPGKFVLTLSPGNSVVLDVAAVKDYSVLAGAVGQTLVQVEVDRTKLPENVQTSASPATLPAYELKSPVFDRTLPYIDFSTLPVIDNPTQPVIDELRTIPIVDQGGKGIFEGLPGDPGDPGDPYAAGAPFALATAHQAPESALALAQGVQGIGAFRTVPVLDYTLAARDVTHPWSDIKNPWRDGATGRLPYLD
jgi:hypothetical protein